MASSSLPLHHPSHCLISNPQLKGSNYGWSPRPRYTVPTKDAVKGIRIQPIKAKAATEAPPFSLFQPPEAEGSASELEPADPDFYKIGYVRSMRAYGIEFKEGPDGFGVYASKDVEPLRRARVIMEIPLELMLTVSQKLPWMFFPDIVPVGHPIFDIINSTDPETDWDLRLACLLLYAFDREDNFWQLYGDFLPSADECPSLLLASEEELSELQNPNLASTMREQQRRALEFWEKNWVQIKPAKKKRGKSLYARWTDPGLDLQEAAKRLKIDWDTAAEIDDAELSDESEVPPVLLAKINGGVPSQALLHSDIQL